MSAGAQPSTRVLVAVSDDGGLAAIGQAARSAAELGAEIHVLHVVDLVPRLQRSGSRAPRPNVRNAAEVLDAAAAHARQAAGPDPVVTSELAHGDVVDRILAAAHGSTLTVLERGTAPDLGGRDREVCVRIAARAPGAVICVPWTWTASRAHPTVTVGWEDTDGAASALGAALALVTRRGGRLRVVHAVSPSRLDDEVRHDRRAVEQAVAEMAPSGMVAPVEVDVVRGSPGAALCEASSMSDLVVVGRHRPHRPAGTSLGEVARAVLTWASCPVLLAPVPTEHHPSPAAGDR